MPYRIFYRRHTWKLRYSQWTVELERSQLWTTDLRHSRLTTRHPTGTEYWVKNWKKYRKITKGIFQYERPIFSKGSQMTLGKTINSIWSVFAFSASRRIIGRKIIILPVSESPLIFIVFAWVGIETFRLIIQLIIGFFRMRHYLWSTKWSSTLVSSWVFSPQNSWTFEKRKIIVVSLSGQLRDGQR